MTALIIITAFLIAGLDWCLVAAIEAATTEPHQDAGVPGTRVVEYAEAVVGC